MTHFIMRLWGFLAPNISYPATRGTRLSQFKADIFGGLTAAVVALPLALAFGVTSGAGAISGLYGAIAVGTFAALFGGTPAQVSGPTGPMTVVMAAVIATHSTNLSEAFTIVMIGGVLQIVFGFLRIGKYVAYTPYSVVSGFMTGIGVIIIIIQILPFIGLPGAADGTVGALHQLALLNPEVINLSALGLALLSLGIVVFWPAGLQRYIPAPLAALIIGTLMAVFWLNGVPEIGEVPSGLPTIIKPQLSFGAMPQLVQAGFILALLGSIDSLLTSLVADSMTRTQHDSDKELVGQGLGNLIAGLIGGLPGAGATMRTVVNVRAGGRTPISGVVHALLLLSMALGLGPLVSHVPLAVLAGILMKVGWDIIDWAYLKHIRQAPREKVVIMLITFLLTVFVDLITSVAVGIILASFVNSRWLAEEQIKSIKQTSGSDDGGHLTPEERAMLRNAQGKILVNLLHGSFSYASAREMVRRIPSQINGCQTMIYDFSGAGYIDTSAALAIDELITQATNNGHVVFISNLQGVARRTMEGLGILDRISPQDIFVSRKEAIDQAVKNIAETG